MFNADQNQPFISLSNKRRGCTWDKQKGCLILLMPVAVFCVSIPIVFLMIDKCVYPVPFMNSFSSKTTVLKDQHRAALYSADRLSIRNLSEIPMNRHQALELTQYKLVCYYNFPTDKLSLKIHGIDPNLCTHLNLAFASVQNNSIYLDAKNREYLKEAVKLKTFNKDLKILLSVGGASNDDGFSVMVLNHTNRKTFIKSVIAMAFFYKIDGIDLDWEFPGMQPSFDKNQRIHMTQLMSELRKSVTRRLNSTFLLTLAVAAPVEIIDVSYDVSYLNDYVDFINLMTYDFHYYTSLTPFTGHNAPLYASSTDKYYLATLNINYSSHYWNYLGMDKSKIVVGLPTYGHSFKLINQKNAGLYAPASGFGKLGQKGFVSYPQTCIFLRVNQIAPVFDMETMSPYATKFYEWISFDDPQSLTYKTEFIKSNKFGGAMVYSLNADDYLGFCTSGKDFQIFPLVKAIKKVLERTG